MDSHGVISVLSALLPISFQIPTKVIPITKLPQTRDVPFPEPSNCLLKYSVNGLHRFLHWPLRGKAPVSSIFSTPSLKVPGKYAPLPRSPSGSLWREKLHLQGQCLIHSFIPVGVPNKEPTHEKRGKYSVSIHGFPHGWKAYVQYGVASFPKRIVEDTAIFTPLPGSLQHDTFYLGFGRPEPS